MEKDKYQPFANLLRKSRKKHGYTQSEICDLAGKLAEVDKVQLNLSQRTLSAWESARQLPDKEKIDKLRYIAEVLEVNFAEFKKALERQITFGDTMPQGIAKKELFSDAQGFVKKVGAANLDLWFIGLEHLPVCDDEVVENIWIDNLKEGCTYNLIWFLDQISSSTFNQLSIKIEGISKNIPNSDLSGKITNYALFLMADETNLAVSSIRKDYERLCCSKNSFAEWVHPFTVDSIKLQSIKNEILKYWQCTSSIILYSTRAKAREIPSNAALHLKNFYLDLNESEAVSPFLWYASAHVDRIEQIVAAIQDLKVD